VAQPCSGGKGETKVVDPQCQIRVANEATNEDILKRSSSRGARAGQGRDSNPQVTTGASSLRVSFVICEHSGWLNKQVWVASLTFARLETTTRPMGCSNVQNVHRWLTWILVLICTRESGTRTHPPCTRNFIIHEPVAPPPGVLWGPFTERSV